MTGLWHPAPAVLHTRAGVFAVLHLPYSAVIVGARKQGVPDEDGRCAAGLRRPRPRSPAFPHLPDRSRVGGLQGIFKLMSEICSFRRFANAWWPARIDSSRPTPRGGFHERCNHGWTSPSSGPMPETEPVEFRPGPGPHLQSGPAVGDAIGHAIGHPIRWPIHIAWSEGHRERSRGASEQWQRPSPGASRRRCT